MKVLLVVTKGNLGGAQKRILDLASNYQKQGIDVVVGVGREGDWLPAQLRSAGIAHHRFKNLRRSKNPAHLLSFLLELRKYLANHDFDIVHLNSSNSLVGALAAKISNTKAKTVFTFRGLSVLSPNYPSHFLLTFFYRWYFRLFLLFVDAGVFQCKADRNKALSLGVHSKKTIVIRPGINPKDIGYLYRETARRRLANQINTSLDKRFVIGSIGRLSKQKNYKFLLSAAENVIKKHPQVMFLLVGDGPQSDKLVDMIHASETLRGNVFLLGKITAAARFIPGFDLFVLPSRYEGVSMTLTEAVHAGVPILASDVGGNRETLCGNEASLFSLGGEDELAERIEKLVVDQQAREQAIPKDSCQSTLLLSGSVKEYKSLYERVSKDL